MRPVSYESCSLNIQHCSPWMLTIVGHRHEHVRHAASVLWVELRAASSLNLVSWNCYHADCPDRQIKRFLGSHILLRDFHKRVWFCLSRSTSVNLCVSSDFPLSTYPRFIKALPCKSFSRLFSVFDTLVVRIFFVETFTPSLMAFRYSELSCLIIH